ncbi:MAG: B-4DMT family transporter [Mycobacterium sp.]|uniref:B-4DMT family transporter n=1 Tax=Mycobacterium sp. TaxID=1785 RepID=UPI003CC66F33
MAKWMVRGLVFAAAMVVVRLVQGVLINAFQTMAGLISVALILLFLIAVMVWGLIDGRADARENPDPDRRADLAMVWLVAGLVAGVVSGAVSWLVSLLYRGLYVGGLINEITTFAAFTALLVFLPGMGAVTLGRYLIDRKGSEARRQSGEDDDGTDTDVFDAVRDDSGATRQAGARDRDQGRTEAAAGQRDDEQTSAVATADHTQAAPAGSDAERTRPTRTSSNDDER